MTAVNSFFKQPLVEVEVREADANDDQQEDEAMAEQEEMDEDEESSKRPCNQESSSLEIGPK